MQSPGWRLRDGWGLGMMFGFQSSLGEILLSPWTFWPPYRCIFPKRFEGRTGTLGHISNSSACQPGTTHVSELHQPQLPELSHAAVGSLHLQEELHQAHLLTPEDGGHLSRSSLAWKALEIPVVAARSSLSKQLQEGARLCRNIEVTESECWMITHAAHRVLLKGFFTF